MTRALVITLLLACVVVILSQVFSMQAEPALVMIPGVIALGCGIYLCDFGVREEPRARSCEGRRRAG